MRRTAVLGGIVAMGLLVFSHRASAITVVGVGVYDSAATGSTNNVDHNATFVSATGVGSAANVTSAGTGADPSTGAFNQAIVTAFANNMGGVDNYDGGSNGQTDNSRDVFFGVDQTKWVRITNHQALVGLSITSQAGNRAPISGLRFLNKNTGATNDYAFNILSAVGNGDPDEHVVQLGFTFLARGDGDAGLVTATAFFLSDDSISQTDYKGSVTLSRNMPAGDGETFFGFVAPAGYWIRRVEVDVEGTAFGGVDDMGFITAIVPEPASMGVLGMSGLLLFRRRRSA